MVITLGARRRRKVITVGILISGVITVAQITWPSIVRKKNGFVTEDYRTVLVSVDDVARVNWGGSWRMPTLNEIIELINNCTWEWRNYNGVNGQLVTGPNGNSIFLPAAGFCSDGDILGSDNCFYWSATLSDYGDDSAYILYIIDHPQPWAPAYRNQGFPVRPVTE